MSRLGGLLPFIPASIFLIVAFILVFVRPGVITWAYYIYAVGFFGTGPPFMFWAHIAEPHVYFALSFIVNRRL